MNELGLLTGEFKEGMAHGFGHFVSTDEKVTYTGQYYEDAQHGIGIKTGPDYQFVGNFSQELFEGFGEMSGVDSMCGDWEQGLMVSGLLERDESTYFGQFSNNQKDGKGTTVDSNGQLYSGEYQLDKKSG